MTKFYAKSPSTPQVCNKKILIKTVNISSFKPTFFRFNLYVKQIKLLHAIEKKIAFWALDIIHYEGM